MSWNLFNRPESRRAPAVPRRRPRSRRVALESLEARHLLTNLPFGSLPFGALPDDTGEYMLGDVHVTVVLMESNPGLSPHDNGTVTIAGDPVTYEPETWSESAIAAVKANVQSGLQWWSDTLDALPNVRDGLLNFTYDFTHADAPVDTGYEPIARLSNDFSLWMYDFLNVVGFNETGNFSSDIRAFNNFQRTQHDTDWAFTIFVVNDEKDPDDRFHTNSALQRAFAFSGGRFMVVPASRPDSTYAHEAGHMFWAFDEYAGGGNTYQSRRGYYNTQNLNNFDNPTPGFQQAPSIMSSGGNLNTAFANHTSAATTLEMIGWKDSDNDGIFDVLDVPFDLSGVGMHDSASGVYQFTGTSAVRTLPNLNPMGLQNDITINRIRRAEYKIDSGEWQAVASYDAYETILDLSFPVPEGNHEIRIRTVDTRTGAMSHEFIGSTSEPSQTISSGVGGFLYNDENNNGSWDSGERPLVDWGVELVNAQGELMQLRANVEPDMLAQGAVLNDAIQGITLTAIGDDTQGGAVISKASQLLPSADNVLHSNSVLEGHAVETWTGRSRRLKVTFSSPATVVNVKALGAGAGGSLGRLEVYDANDRLLGRYTTKELGLGDAEIMTFARPQGDIAYAIAGGHAGTEVLLDMIQWGPKATVSTDVNGRYVLPNLPGGDYHVRIIPASPNYLATTENGVEAAVQLSGGQALANVNFGFRSLGSAWQNAAKPLDVNDDGYITSLDALIVINRLNSPNASSLPATRGNGEWYVDVNADLYVTALDALLVINYLNGPQANFAAGRPAAPPTETAASDDAGSFSFTAENGSGESSGEGEELARLSPALNAAEYYARQPFHVLNLPGDDKPCACGACIGESIDTLVDSLDDSPSATDDLLADAAVPAADHTWWLQPRKIRRS